MKPLFLACAASLLVATAASAQMPKYGVTVQAEKKVDFNTLKTYTWTKGQPSLSTQIDGQIVAAVDRELAALGMTKAASGPGDVLVAYYSVTRTDVNVKAKADSKGLQPQYTVGTLMVALLDPKSRDRLLRLRIDKPIDTDSAASLEAAINGATVEMFEKYPTRTAKKK